jgi:hypothetical protein
MTAEEQWQHMWELQQLPRTPGTATGTAPWSKVPATPRTAAGRWPAGALHAAAVADADAAAAAADVLSAAKPVPGPAR